MASAPKQPKAPPAPSLPPLPKQAQVDTTSWNGMGPQLPADPMSMGTQATGQGLAPPSWMQGDIWGAPWWGQQAPNVGAAMMQQQDPEAYARMQAMQYGQPAPPPPPPPQRNPYQQFQPQQEYPSGREYWGDNYGGFGQRIDQSREWDPMQQQLMSGMPGYPYR